MTDIDPIAELVGDLVRYGRPSLPWVVRWSADQQEPVFAAWNASKSPIAMFEIIKLTPIEVFASIKWTQRGRWLDVAFGSETGPDDDHVTYVITSASGLKIWARRGLVQRWKGPPAMTEDPRYAPDVVASQRSANLFRALLPTPPTLDELIKLAKKRAGQ